MLKKHLMGFQIVFIGVMVSMGVFGCSERHENTLCSYQGESYLAGTKIPISDSCLHCICDSKGVVSCDESLCTQEDCVLGDTHLENGASMMASDGCNMCTCFHGETHCSSVDCDALCIPGDVFPSVEGCPPCVCDANGDLLCPPCDMVCLFNGVPYYEGAVFPYGDPCNECECLGSGEVHCTADPCTQDCLYGEEIYQPGDLFSSGDENDCGECVCHPDGTVSCLYIPCSTRCYYDDKIFEEGDVFPHADGCNTCECLYPAVISCTEEPCELTCVYGGETYQNGEQIPGSEPCEVCGCKNGEVVCTLDGCTPGCMYEGEFHILDASFPMVGECGVCSCVAPARVTCVLGPCDTCFYDGIPYEKGATFSSIDGCNQCVCNEDVSVSCGTLSCDCDPAVEWDREYVSNDTETCVDLEYGCPGSTSTFSNGCGCGCVQSDKCLQVYQCGAGTFCNIEALHKECPYSIVIMQ